MNDQFNWDDDEDFRDIPDEVQGKDTPAPLLPPTQNPRVGYSEPKYEDDGDQEYDELSEAPAPEEDGYEDYSEVLSDARLRLEQGRLYEMIMNHDLFGGIDSDPKAVKSVQRQIRHFAKEQMEIMLGMRRQPEERGSSLSVDLPFNSLEVEALRALASAATKGATKSPDVEKYVASVAPRQSGLNQIGKKQSVRERPLANKPSAPVRRTKTDPNLEVELRNRGIEQEYIEEAKRQLAQERYKPLEKKVDQMSREELANRNKEIALRTHTQVRPMNAMPMATPEQMEAMALSRAAAAQSHPGMIRIMDLLNRRK